MSSAPTTGTMMSYLKRPYFPAGRERVGEAQLKHLTQILFLSLVLMIVLSGLIAPIIASVKGDIPTNANETIGQNNPAQLLLIGVFIAPIVEELLFRSWLGGRQACILGLPILISLFAVSVSVSVELPTAISVGLAVGLSLMVLAVARQYTALTPAAQKAARWTLFPFAFYGSALLFALLHLQNYEGGLSSPIMLLAVLPQALVGLILGYVRMRFGLFHAIIFHALYNLVLIGVFLMAQSIAPLEAQTGDSQATIVTSLPLSLAICLL